MPFPDVAAFLRLGKKYNIPVLVKEAKAKLMCFAEPTSISTFDKLKEAKPPAQPIKLFPGITDADPYNFQIMNLLQEVGFKVPLPLAMYHCMVYFPSTAIVGGYHSNGATYTLSLANLRVYIRMKQVFEHFKVLVSLGTYTSASCTRPICGGNNRRVWVQKAINAPPFCHWNSEWNELMCEACRNNMQDKRAKAIGDAWDRLPIAFGFKTWEEAKKWGDSST